MKHLPHTIDKRTVDTKRAIPHAIHQVYSVHKNVMLSTSVATLYLNLLMTINEETQHMLCDRGTLNALFCLYPLCSRVRTIKLESKVIHMGFLCTVHIHYDTIHNFNFGGAVQKEHKGHTALEFHL